MNTKKNLKNKKNQKKTKNINYLQTPYPPYLLILLVIITIIVVISIVVKNKSTLNQPSDKKTEEKNENTDENTEENQIDKNKEEKQIEEKTDLLIIGGIVVLIGGIFSVIVVIFLKTKRKSVSPTSVSSSSSDALQKSSSLTFQDQVNQINNQNKTLKKELQILKKTVTQKNKIRDNNSSITISSPKNDKLLKRALKQLDKKDTEKRKQENLKETDKTKKELKGKTLKLLEYYTREGGLSNEGKYFNTLENITEKQTLLNQIERNLTINNDKYTIIFKFEKMCNIPLNICRYLSDDYELSQIDYILNKKQNIILSKYLETYQITTTMNTSDQLFKNLEEIGKLKESSYIDQKNKNHLIFDPTELTYLFNEIKRQQEGKNFFQKMMTMFFKKKDDKFPLNINEILNSVIIFNPETEKTYKVTDQTFGEFYENFINVYKSNKEYFMVKRLDKQAPNLFKSFIVSKFIDARSIELVQKKQKQKQNEDNNKYKIIILLQILLKNATILTNPKENERQLARTKLNEINNSISGKPLSNYSSQYLKILLENYYSSPSMRNIDLDAFQNFFINFD